MSDLDALEEKLSRAESGQPLSEEELQAQKDAENKRVGLQAGVELTASIVAGVVIGVLLDRFFDTQPIFMIIMFFLGVFTGFFNVYRVTNSLGSAVGFAQLKKQRDKALHLEEKNAKTVPNSNED